MRQLGLWDFVPGPCIACVSLGGKQRGHRMSLSHVSRWHERNVFQQSVIIPQLAAAQPPTTRSDTYILFYLYYTFLTSGHSSSHDTHTRLQEGRHGCHVQTIVCTVSTIQGAPREGGRCQVGGRSGWTGSGRLLVTGENTVGGRFFCIGGELLTCMIHHHE